MPGSDVFADDAALVRRCLRNDGHAVRALVDRFQAEIYGLCVRLLGHRHDAEDVTQEVFLRIFRSLRRWDASRPLRPWVMGIAVNRCRTWMAQRVRRPELVDYLQDTATGPAPDDSTELLAEIRDAVAALRPDYRTVFVLFHEHGHPYDEIAAAMDRPVGTVKTWLHRARLEVLEHLKRRGMVADETLPDRVSSGTPPTEG
jgi:RNA polymerase sigma-70 factor (ECF subfamily)